MAFSILKNTRAAVLGVIHKSLVVGFRLCIALENCRIEQGKAKRGTHNDKQGGRDHAKLWTAAEQLKDGSSRDDGQDHPANKIGLGTSSGTSASNE